MDDLNPFLEPGMYVRHPTERDWGCRNCDAAFFKNTQENLDALNGIWRRKSEPEPEEKVYKRTEKEKDELIQL